MLAETKAGPQIAFAAEYGAPIPPPLPAAVDEPPGHTPPACATAPLLLSRRGSARIVDSARAILAGLAATMAAGVSPGDAYLAAAGILYALHALFLLWLGKRRPLAESPLWCAIDIACCLLFFQLSGRRPEFFVLLAFPLLHAGLRLDMRSSAMLAAFAAAGIALAQAEAGGPGLSGTLLLFCLAPGIALLNRGEVRIRSGEELAEALLERLDPRTGLDSLASEALNAIAAHFGADAGLLVLRTHDSRTRVFCRDAGEAAAELGRAAAQAAARTALSVPDGLALASSTAPLPAWLRHPRIATGVRPRRSGESPGGARQAAAVLHELLEQPEVLSVPAVPNSALAARLILGRAAGCFERSTVEAAARMLERIVPVLLYASLLEQLAAEAAETERARIGRDLHDSAVQPYIGLKFAVEAVARRCPEEAPLAADLRQLVRMVSSELASMRDVIGGLRSLHGDGEALLEAAVRRQAARFGQLFGIEVKVAIEGEMPVSRRLAQEIFHMVSEGLSNIRRHTAARRAEILLISEGDALSLCIFNAAVSGEPPPPRFEPRSIGMRARELGGSAQVSITPAGTSVTVCLPIPMAKKR